MNTAGIREQRSVISWPEAAASACSVRGCERSTFGGRNGMCVDCADMDAEYDEYFSVKQRNRRARIAKRLHDAALLALFVFLMSWLAIEVWPRLWVAIKVWEMN